nr:hypothetical protein [Tanacetum cinerariifolium]
ALDEFKKASSLVPSLPKSTAYFCNVLNHVKLSILQALPFEEGKLLVKYLGVPLVSSRLMIRDYNELIDKVQIRIQDWKNKALLIAGKGKSKVAWESVCLPKDEGGLEPIGCFVAHRDMARDGLTPNSKVHDIIINGSCLWPHDLIAKFLALNSYNVPTNEYDVDRLVWRDIHGNDKKFSVSQVRDDIRFRDSKVNWYSMVWFPSCIPRHAINLWLIVRRKLKTQDLIPAWDVSSSFGVVCSLCESNPDSHDHLFFECPIASGIWNRVKGHLLPIVKYRTTVSVIAKLVVAASAYYVRQERNWRLFKKGKRNSDQIVECIVSSVLLKLLSCKLKKSKSGERMARLWDLPEVVFI